MWTTLSDENLRSSSQPRRKYQRIPKGSWFQRPRAVYCIFRWILSKMPDRRHPCWDEPIKEAVNRGEGRLFSDPRAGSARSRPCAFKKGLVSRVLPKMGRAEESWLQSWGPQNRLEIQSSVSKRRAVTEFLPLSLYISLCSSPPASGSRLADR